MSNKTHYIQKQNLAATTGEAHRIWVANELSEFED